MRSLISAPALSLVPLLAALGALIGLGPQQADAPAQPERSGAPYLLSTCAVSERPLPEGGGTIVIMSGTDNPAIEGREFRFCCPGCISRFKKDPMPFIAKVDERMIKDQTPRYPPGTCLVMNERELPDPKGPEADDCTQLIWKNRLVRLCCKRCERVFRQDPDQYIARLDAAAIAHHAPNYPLDTCIATGRPLGENPHTFMLGDHVVKVCCAGCRPRVENDWSRMIAATNATIRSSGDVKKAREAPSGPIRLLSKDARASIVEKYPDGEVYSVNKSGNAWLVELRTADGSKRRIQVSNDGWIVSDRPAG